MTGVAIAQISSGVPAPQPASGTPANVLASGFDVRKLATGSDLLENPTSVYKTYGYIENNADPLARTRTEPDKNTYLKTEENPGGPTPGYDYGRNFLIQGHENGGGKAYLTRINLDVTDPKHRITLLSKSDAQGNTGLSSIDGSTYDPFNGNLLFTSEGGSNGRVVQTPLRWSTSATPDTQLLDGSIGRGGYEGIHPDSQGNLYIVEDTGGSGVTDNGKATKVKQPNSFIYRFKPTKRTDLTQGRLQALQVLVDGTPVTFHPAATDPTGARNDALGEAIRRLHTGETLTAKWITVHDTAVDGTATFDANALAKAKGGTPLKRPENGEFVPGSDFKSLVISETGDTDKTAGEYPGAAARASWGALDRIDMPKTGSDEATFTNIELGDLNYASFDNLTFLDKDTLLAAEDRGDTLHQQAGFLDSIWSFDLRRTRAEINGDAKRLVALGRDPESLNNQHEDNEPTGIFVSDGSTQKEGLFGAEDPADESGVRIFYTQQHGQNTTYEVVPPKQGEESQDQNGPDDQGQHGDKR